MNRWNIPAQLEQDVIQRDRYFVYRGIELRATSQPRRSRPSWEHIVDDARIVSIGNIARCCTSCNASKGAKDISVWLDSSYCKRRGIILASVADVVKRAIEDPPKVKT